MVPESLKSSGEVPAPRRAARIHLIIQGLDILAAASYFQRAPNRREYKFSARFSFGASMKGPPTIVKNKGWGRWRSKSHRSNSRCSNVLRKLRLSSGSGQRTYDILLEWLTSFPFDLLYVWYWLRIQ